MDLLHNNTIFYTIWHRKLSRNPFFEGAYSNWPPGYGKDSHDALKALVGRIYFAGEHTSYFYYGYMHRSYEFGFKLANALGKCIQQADCPNYVPLYASRGWFYASASTFDTKAKLDDL